MIKLHSDWRRLLKRAWSLRLMALAAVLSAAEVGLGFVDASALGLPRGVFAALAAAVSLLAFPARLIAQRSMQDGSSQN